MKKNDLLKLIINSTKEDFSLEDIKELTGLKEEIELQEKVDSRPLILRPMTNTEFNDTEKSDFFEEGLNELSKKTDEGVKNFFSPYNIKERVRLLPPFYITETETVIDRRPGKDFLSYSPGLEVKDETYLEVLNGNMHPMHYIKSKDRALNNYYIKSLMKTLRLNGNRISSKAFTGINSIIQSIENNTHQDYLKEMNKRLCYVLNKEENKFTITNIITNILEFLVRYSTPARTAIYLWKSSLILKNSAMNRRYMRNHPDISIVDKNSRYYVDTMFSKNKPSALDLFHYLDKLYKIFNIDKTLTTNIKIEIRKLNFDGSSNITDFLLVNRDTYFYNKLLNDAINMLDAIHHGVHLEPQNEYRFKKALENTAKLFGILDFNERLKKGDLAVLGQVEKFIHENSEIL